MRLSNLSSFETLNTQSLSFINGGAAALADDSKRNDSETKDCKKRDVFN